MRARRSAGRLLGAALLAITVAAPCASHAGTTNTYSRTVSASHQFVAYASQPLLPAALCVFAEKVNREWLSQIEAADSWRDPVIFVVQERAPAQSNAPPATLEVFRTDLHLKYQIRCLVPPPLSESSLLDVVVEALCAETANRTQRTSPAAPYVVAPVPQWLVQGLAQAMRGQGDVLLGIARRSVAAGRPQRAVELLETTALPGDPLERELFRANAWLFTQGLLNIPDGGRKMQRYLAELGAQKSVTNAFRTVYRQDFPQPVALEKWWALQLARRTSVEVAQNLSALDTKRRLEEILRVKLVVPGRKGTRSSEIDEPVSRLWTYYDTPWIKDVLRNKLFALQALRAQAHPRYQDVIGKYSEAVAWLLDKKLNRFRRAVRHADDARAAIERESRETTAYLDQAERIFAPEDPARLFEGYFQTLDKFQNLEQERRNPISDYLDKFDQ
jgi:hypothetical protein